MWTYKFESTIFSHEPYYCDTGRVCGMKEKRDAYKVLVGKPEGKRPL
jgi:hypothetical protein